MHVACWRGDLDTVQSLYRHQGAKVDLRDHEGRTPLLLACANGQLDTARWLHEQGAEVIDERCQPIYAASSQGHLKVVQ